MDLPRQLLLIAIEVAMNDEGCHRRAMRPGFHQCVWFEFERIVEIDMGSQLPMNADRHAGESEEENFEINLSH